MFLRCRLEFFELHSQCKAYREEIAEALGRVLDHTQFILGEEVALLESVLAEFLGVKHAIATSNGTDSLLIALLALGIGRGDEVITVPFTWISPVSMICSVGAYPVFVDIDPKTYCIDSSLIEEKITSRTKAIMPVSLFGQMPNFTEINALANKYNLAVIEDGAQSFGSEQKGVKSGGASLIGSTSFFPSKPLGCYGDGGALFTCDDQLAEKCKMLRNHGKGGDQLHHMRGINGRMDTLQAAILLAKFPFFLEEIKMRQRVAKRYSEHLPHPPFIEEGNTHIFAQYTIRVDNRDEVAAHLARQKIPTRVYYPHCAYEHPGYAFLQQGCFPESEKATRQVLSLPFHPWLEERDQIRVIEALQCVSV